MKPEIDHPSTTIDHEQLTKSIKLEIKTWERDFMQENGRKPTKQDVYDDKDIFELYKLFNRLKTQHNTGGPEEGEDKSRTSDQKTHDDGKQGEDGAAKLCHDSKHQITKTVQPDLASRTSALRKHHAAKRILLQVNQPGKAVHSGLISPILPPLITNPTTHPPPSPIESTPENQVLVTDDDQLIAHPTTVHIVAPELVTAENNPTPVVQFDAFTDRHDDDASSKTNLVGGLVSSCSSSGSADPPVDVLASLGIDRLAIPSDVFKVPEENQVFRGHVSRIKVPTRPNLVSFHLKNEANNVLVACARREPSLKLKPTYYLFDFVPQGSEPSRDSACWKIKSNFEGSTFRIIETRTSELVGLIHYTSACVPRAMFAITSTPTSGPITQRQYELLVASHFSWPPPPTSELANSRLRVFTNQLPKFNETLKTFCLNFHGRVTLPSVKNFQLALNELALPKPDITSPSFTSSTHESSVRLQFGRVANNAFSIDVHSPLMIMMGFAISLTTFDAIEKV